MKKILCAVIIHMILFSVISCTEKRSAYELLSSFVDAYGARGVIYSPTVSDGEDGYIDRDMFRRIYAFGDEFPEDFAVLLNLHTDTPAECAVFICRDTAELDTVYEMCEERVRLLSVPDSSFIVRCDTVLFYSTLPDVQRARRIWHRVIS